MLRLICRETDMGAAANVGGPVHTSFHTFDDTSEAEAWLRAQAPYITREVMGVELAVAPIALPAPLERCPGCFRPKARSADDCAVGCCSRWYAIRDPEAVAECQRLETYWRNANTGERPTAAQIEAAHAELRG